MFIRKLVLEEFQTVGFSSDVTGHVIDALQTRNNIQEGIVLCMSPQVGMLPSGSKNSFPVLGSSPGRQA